ncbi:MAG: porin family protein [Prevotellaceae bacterium]|jgi:outer membrane protein X|nr:porin family protein [Prevotellaceae bacterium]
MRNFNVFKKVAIVVIAIATMSVAANAQDKGDMAIGGNLATGMGDELNNFGLGAKFQYNVLKPLRLEGSATYFFPRNQYVSNLSKSSLSMWDFSANGHYLVPVSDKCTLYPLAGLSVLVVNSVTKSIERGGRYRNSTSEAGLNLGGGVDFKLSNNIILNAEMKYKIGNMWDRFILSAGLSFLIE